jgi:hypothetical protein
VTSADHNRLLIDKLSDTEKDELIVRLWRDLQEARTRCRDLEERLARLEHEAGAGGASPLLAKLQEASPPPPKRASDLKVRLGRGLGFLRSRVVLGAILIIGLAFALDYAIGRYHQYRMTQQRLAALKLEHAAYQGLYLELVKVAYEPDQKSYRVTMKMTNVEPGRPIYVMQGPVRVFEQSGLAWKEVPARAPNGEGTRVIKLTGPYTYETVFEPNLKDWTELMPGYMHIRFESVSLISERSDPDDDIVERTDRYYVYLKPHGADDEAIRKRMKYQGEPPVYMPMPPH